MRKPLPVKLILYKNNVDFANLQCLKLELPICSKNRSDSGVTPVQEDKIIPVMPVAIHFIIKTQYIIFIPGH